MGLCFSFLFSDFECGGRRVFLLIVIGEFSNFIGIEGVGFVLWGWLSYCLFSLIWSYGGGVGCFF